MTVEQIPSCDVANGSRRLRVTTPANDRHVALKCGIGVKHSFFEWICCKHVSARRGKSGQRDLTLARVLYRLGDFEGIGQRILTRYAHDIRGHYARHAQAILDEGPFPRL